jgi:arylsulfatase A-like enzyme
MRPAVLRLAIALSALLALSCARTPELPGDVVLVSIDTLRADRVGCYGHPDAGTPTLDALAARGVRFADASAPTPVTLPSHATLFTGTDPLRHGVRHNGLFALARDRTTLAERLRAAGFRTGGFVGSLALSARYGVDQGFEAWGEPGRGRKPGTFFLGERPASEVNQEALAWLDGVEGARVFLFVHYMEPHAPFRPPEPERSRFADDPYQGEIAAADRALGELLQALAERGRLERALVLVAGDHGEALGDHGELSHGVLLYQPTLRVPLIAAGPGVVRGGVVRAPVGLVDVMPTLLDAAGLAPADAADGRSLWPALGGAGADAERRLYAESFVPRYDYGWSELRALREGPYKYVAAPRPELYDLSSDPGETRNLATSRPERAGRMAAALARRVQDAEQGTRSAQRVSLPVEERQALQRLGYLPGAHEGLPVDPSADPKDHIDVVAALDWASRRVHEGRPAEAERALRELLARSPDSALARLHLVVAIALQDRNEEASQEARRLIETARRLPDGARVAARAHAILGDLYAARGQLEEAARAYEQGILTPQPARVYDDLAGIYQTLGRRDDALRVLHILESRGDATDRTRELLDRLQSAGPPS